MFKHALVVGLVALLTATTLAAAQPSFSVDLQGPLSIPSGGPFCGADILVPTPPAPGPGPLSLPTVAVPSGALGVFPGMQNAAELDALSYGMDDPEAGILFSVDEFAAGTPGTPLPPAVWTEGAAGAGEASADVFTYLGPPGPVPPGQIFGNTATFDGDGFAPSGAPGLGLIEPNPPTQGMVPDPGDNIDALDSLAPQERIYFSLDTVFPDPLEVPGFNTGTAAANGFVGGDVLMTAPGAAARLYAPAIALGLDLMGPDTDDLDGLMLWDTGVIGEYEPGLDFLLFSVRRGSAVIGMPDAIFGAPIEEGDVLVPTGPGAPPGIWVPGEAMGLATMRSGAAGPFGPDDLDALTAIPEPASLGLLLLGAPALIGRRRRRA